MRAIYGLVNKGHDLTDLVLEKHNTFPLYKKFGEP